LPALRLQAVKNLVHLPLDGIQTILLCSESLKTFENDFVEALAFSKTSGVVMTGVMCDKAGAGKVVSPVLFLRRVRNRYINSDN